VSSAAPELKRAANAEYAKRFPRRDRVARKKARRIRVEQRDRTWLERMGLA